MKRLITILLSTLCTLSVHAETEYLCDSIPFIPNVPPLESCGNTCKDGDISFNNHYVKNLYPNAKAMYQQGNCSEIKVIRTYKDTECGGIAYEKSITSGMQWTEYVGGNTQCLINRERKMQQQRINEAIYEK